MLCAEVVTKFLAAASRYSLFRDAVEPVYDARSRIVQWFLCFTFSKKYARFFGPQGCIEKKYTQRVYFLRMLKAKAQQLNLICQLNGLIPIEVLIRLVASNHPGAGRASLILKVRKKSNQLEFIRRKNGHF